jgi:seryl-tRNA synthetase
MLDVRRLRNDLEATKAAMARRHDPELLTQLGVAAALDARERDLVAKRDDARKKVNEISKQIAGLRRAGESEAVEALMAESRLVGDAERALAAEAADVAERVRDLLLRVPNLPSDLTPDGVGADDNVVLREHAPDPSSYAEYQRVPHWEIGAALGILDLERATKISGSMFTMLRGLGATMSRAMCQFALDRHADAFEEIRPPSLVTTATLTATGQLPKFADDAYHLERDDLWAIPTAEAPLTSVARDEILEEAGLPLRLMAYTPCFRRESGSAGRDTRGMLRNHEFDKVEIFAVSTPEQAPALLDEFVSRAESTVAALGLAYRVVEICAGDLGQGHHRSIDIEVHAPGSAMWLEVSSVSWFSDYQARRANIRYRPSQGKGTEIAHTLNGSALAVPRVWAAIVETNRQPDGSVAIPEVLWPYMRGARVIAAP